MKNFRVLFIMMATVMFAVGCSEQKSLDDDLSAKKATFLSNERWNELDFCNLQTHELIGGQTILMGNVYVGNTADSLYVKYVADEGYVITETHLFVGDVMGEDFPKTKKSSPKIGHFPYAAENFGGSSVVMYSISLDEIEGDCFDIAAHAVVECEDGTCEETAWAAGEVFDELVIAAKSWFYGAESGTSEGIQFAENCYLYEQFGYITLDLNNISSESYDLIADENIVVGILNISITDEKLIIDIEGSQPEIKVSLPFIYVGSLTDLYLTFGDTDCPDYWSFPYVGIKYQHLEIPINELPLQSTGEPLTLDSKRWMYYLNYCLNDC